MRYAIILLFLTASGWADELQTKDGKKYAFTNLADMGDFWELTTPQGTKISVKKEDYYALIPNGKKEVPLTGASFTFEKKRKLDTIDLLAQIDVKRDSITDGWKRAGATLVGTGDNSRDAKIELPLQVVPEEYDLTVKFERGTPYGEFYVGLIGGGKQLICEFDHSKGSASGVAGVDEAYLQGKLIETKKLYTVVFMVRREVLIVRMDGKDWIAWRANWDKPSFHSWHVPRKKNALWMGVSDGSGSTYTVSGISLTTPKEK